MTLQAPSGAWASHHPEIFRRSGDGRRKHAHMRARARPALAAPARALLTIERTDAVYAQQFPHTLHGCAARKKSRSDQQALSLSDETEASRVRRRRAGVAKRREFREDILVCVCARVRRDAGVACPRFLVHLKVLQHRDAAHGSSRVLDWPKVGLFLSPKSSGSARVNSRTLRCVRKVLRRQPDAVGRWSKMCVRNRLALGIFWQIKS